MILRFSARFKELNYGGNGLKTHKLNGHRSRKKNMPALG